MEKTFLFLYGSMKSGTTWLSRNLEQSPEYWNGGLKEWRFWPSYFNPDLNNRKPSNPKQNSNLAAAWRSNALGDPSGFIQSVVTHMETSPKLRVLGDMTASIGLSSQEISAVSALMRSAGLRSKGLLLMRDPVDRTISELRMKIKNKRPGFELTSEASDCSLSDQIHEIIRAQVDILVARSRYEKHFVICDSVSSVVPYKPIFFENMFSQSSLDEIAEFIGIQKITIINKGYNVGGSLPISSESKRLIARQLEGTYGFFNKKSGLANLPSAWQESINLLD